MGRLVDGVNRVGVILWRLLLGRRALLGGCDPAGVGVEEEEENHAEGHEVHVDAEDDAGVIEAPASLDAADGVEGAKDGEEGGKKDEEVATAIGEAGEEDGGKKREEHQQIGAKKRVTAEIEEYGAVAPGGV
jgi:hypothetical protein